MGSVSSLKELASSRPDDEEFEALRHPGLGAVRLRQRRDLLGVVQHERRLAKLRLHRRLEQFVQHVSHGGRRGDAGDARHRLLIAEPSKRRLRRRLGALEIRRVAAEIAHHVHPRRLLHQIVHGRASPRACAEVDRLVAVRNDESACRWRAPPLGKSSPR